MKRSTGIHKCSNCDWEFDEKKGDNYMIGGMIKPGTKFEDTPSDWRCPVCRASKDAFVEVVEEIPGFEVNQGYGFGTNSWTSGQKNLAIFGGLGLFFLLFHCFHRPPLCLLTPRPTSFFIRFILLFLNHFILVFMIHLIIIMFPLINLKSATFFTKFNALGKSHWVLSSKCPDHVQIMSNPMVSSR